MTPVKVLANALVDARIRALQVEQRPHDVDVEFLLGELGRRDDLVGERQHQLGELRIVEPLFPELLDLRRIAQRRILHQMVGKARQPAFRSAIGIIGLFERVDQAPQVVVGVVGDIRRHLRIAEVRPPHPMRGRAQRPDQVRLAGARLSMEQQDARLARARLARGHRLQQLGELAPRRGVDRLDVDGIRAPQIVFPGDRMLEHAGYAIRVGGYVCLHFHETSTCSCSVARGLAQTSTRTK